MKTKSLNRNTLGLALIASLASPLALAEAPGGGKGGSTSHGGDTLVMEFTGTQINLTEWYSRRGSLSACPAPAMLLDAVKGPNRFQITSEPVVFVNGREEDAATDPDTQPIHTTISRTRLVNKAKDQGYALLALHELFVGLRLETTNDTSKSKGCLDQMIEAGLEVKNTVVSFTPYESIMAAFHEGKAFMSCSSKVFQGMKITLNTHLNILTQEGLVKRFPVSISYNRYAPIPLASYYNLSTGSAEIRSSANLVLHSRTRFKDKRDRKGEWRPVLKKGPDTSSFIEVQSKDGVRFELTLTGILYNLSEVFGGTTQVTFNCEMLYPSAK